MKEAQRVLLAGRQTQRRLYRFGEAHGRAVFVRPSRIARGRLGRMKAEPFGDDGIVTSLDQGDQRRLRRPSSFACEIRRVTGAAQEALHLRAHSSFSISTSAFSSRT